jgi:hypothetical protein
LANAGAPGLHRRFLALGEKLGANLPCRPPVDRDWLAAAAMSGVVAIDLRVGDPHPRGDSRKAPGRDEEGGRPEPELGICLRRLRALDEIRQRLLCEQPVFGGSRSREGNTPASVLAAADREH